MKKNNHTDQPVFIDKNFFIKVFNLRYYYIACVVLFLIIAFFLNKYTPTEYEIYARIGMAQENRSSMLNANELFNVYNSFDQGSIAEYDINSLSSFTLVSKVVTSLNLEVGYFDEKSKLFNQTTELYLRSPFAVNIDKSHIQPIDSRFYVRILSDSTYRLTASEKDISLYNYVDNQVVSENNFVAIDTICKFNETITSWNFKFSVSLKEDFKRNKAYRNNDYFFELYHIDQLSKEYLERLQIVPVSPRSSIIDIRFSGQNLEKLLSFLNKYIETYLEENLAKKNKIAFSTINFINSQLSEVSDSLVLSESQLRNYRSDNQVMDLSYQGQQIYGQLTQIEADRSNLEIQERYFNYVINYFKTNKDGAGVVPPSSMNVSDPIMNQLVTDLIDLNRQKAEILSNSHEKNLFLGQIENKIVNQRQAIVEYVTNNLNTISLSINELNYREDKLSKEIAKLPKKEINLVSIERKFNVNDAIYSFLLQRRSEAAIAMASNYPDYEILEPARKITSEILAPQVFRNYLLALFLGIFIPTAVLIVREFFNDKVSTVNDVETLIDRSVLGAVYSNPHKTEAVLMEYPGSAISESFRNLRGNLFLKLKQEKSKVILISSPQPKDGKSFISFNLATSIASVGYKTIIIDCDLRRPVLHDKFREENSYGVSNFMINSKSVREIIRKTPIENLDFIAGGPVIPNPSELVESGILDDLIKTLTANYDYVIIDSSPMGIVADTIQLMKYASLLLLVCRLNYTRKDVVANVIDNLASHNLNHFEIVLNDRNFKESPYGQYTAYYKTRNN